MPVKQEHIYGSMQRNENGLRHWMSWLSSHINRMHIQCECMYVCLLCTACVRVRVSVDHVSYRTHIHTYINIYNIELRTKKMKNVMKTGKNIIHKMCVCVCLYVNVHG